MDAPPSTRATVSLVIPGPRLQLHGWNLPPGTADPDVVELWLHGRPLHTARAYRLAAARFLAFLADRQAGLQTAGLAELHAYIDSLDGLAATRAARVAAVRSLLSFAHRIGYLPFDVGRAVTSPQRRSDLAERILSEAEVHTMLALEPNPRNQRLLRLLYGAGLRVSELVGLRWRDLQPRDQDAGQLTVFGKGSKTRTVLLPATLWSSLVNEPAAGPDTPLFPARDGRPLDPTTVQRIVRAAGRRAGIQGQVSPHWLRHSHATHALERGAPIHLVAATLGHTNLATTGRYLHARPTDSSARYLAL